MQFLQLYADWAPASFLPLCEITHVCRAAQGVNNESVFFYFH